VINRFWSRAAVGTEIVERRSLETKSYRLTSFRGRTDGTIRANNRLLLSSYHLGDETVDAYLDEIEEFEPEFIDGYPSSIRYCAQRAIETDRDIKIPACFPTAEMLREEDRAIIEEGLSTKVYNQYGSTEGAAIVTECSGGQMHVNPGSGSSRFWTKGESVSEGEVGEIVLTALNNRAMPLIRYRIGDMGRGPRCIASVSVVERCRHRGDHRTSRRSRYHQDGRRVPMLSYNVFKYTESVSESRIIQESVNEFVLQIVPDDGYTDEQAHIAIKAQGPCR